MTEWYLRKTDGNIYGPAELADLYQWATDGRIEPGDKVSSNRATWQPAASLPALEMYYEVILQDGGRYGPLHLEALRELVRSGSIDTGYQVEHVKTNNVRTAGEWVGPADAPAPSEPEASPLAPAPQEQPADTPPTRPEQTDTASIPAAAPQDAARGPDAEAGATADFADAERQAAGMSGKDLRKWKALYESERAQRTAAERALQTQNRDLLDQLHEIQSARDRLRYKVTQLENQLTQTEAGGGPGHVGDGQPDQSLVVAYQQLSANYETMLSQLQDKTDQLNEITRNQTESHSSAVTHVQELEEQLLQEQETASKLRRKHSELEEAHMQLLKSFRDLNDRYIRLREQLPTAGTATSTYPEEPDASAQNEPHDKPRRVRLR